MTRKTIVLFLIGSLAILNSCLDPKAIVDYSKSSIETIQLLDDFGEEYEASCNRLSYYLETSCDKFEGGYKSLLSIQDVLSTYVTALGELADNDFTTYTESLDAFSQEVKVLKAFETDGKKIDAVKKLSSIIIESATAGYKRKQLSLVIKKSNDSFQDVLSGLIDFVDGQFREQLTQEMDKVKSVRRINEVKYKDEPLALEMNKKELLDVESKLKKKIEAIDEYKKALTNLKKGHQELYESNENLDSDDLIKLIETKTKELKSAIKEVKEAFKEE